MEEKEKRDSSEDKIKITEEEIEQGDKIRITEEEVSENKIKITEEEMGGEEKIRITGEEVINRGGKTPISDSYNLNQGQQGYGKYIPARRNTNKMAFILIPAIIIIIAIGAFFVIPRFVRTDRVKRIPRNPKRAMEKYNEVKNKLNALFSGEEEVDIDEIVQKLEEAKKYDPTNPEILETLSNMYILEGNIYKAVEDIDYLSQVKPDSVFVNFLKDNIDSIKDLNSEVENLIGEIQDIGG